MKQTLPILLIIAALAAAFWFSRGTPATNSSTGNPVFTARVLEGQAIPPTASENLRVAVLLAGVSVADSVVENKTYKLELPSQISVPLDNLKQVQLMHGDARLPDSVQGLEAKIVMYMDQNKNAKLDSGEMQVEGTLFTPKSELALQAFFKYKILLLGTPTKLIENQDSATGAKEFYRYNLDLQAGWNILEGEFASNGYEIRLKQENAWDIVSPLPAGGKGDPAGFTPQ